MLENPEQIASLLEVDIDAMMSKLGQQMSNFAAVLQSNLELSTGLELNSMKINSLATGDKEHFSLEEVKRQNPSIWDNVLQVTRNATFNMTAAGTIGGIAGVTIGSFFGGVGAVPGYAIGAAIGSALTGLVGLVTGAKQGLSQLKERNKHAVDIAIKQFIGEAQKHWTRKLNKAVKDLERSMGDEFTSQIKRQQEGYKRTLISLQESRKLSETEAAQRAKELQIPLQQLTQLQNNVAQIAQVIVEQPVTVNSPPVQPATAKTHAPPKQKVTVATDTNADYGDWADE